MKLDIRRYQAYSKVYNEFVKGIVDPELTQLCLAYDAQGNMADTISLDDNKSFTECMFDMWDYHTTIRYWSKSDEHWVYEAKRVP